MKLTYILILLSLALTTSSAYSKIYKWKDANGKIHYSDKPPIDETLRVEEQEVKKEKVSTNNQQASEHATETKTQNIDKATCTRSVANIRRGFPAFKRQLIQRAGGTLDPIKKSLIEGLEKELQAKLSVQSCLESDKKDAALFKCMAKNTDLARCMK